MSHLKNIDTEDLVRRWEQIFPVYIEALKALKEKFEDVNLQRKELILIREELLARNVDVENPDKS